MENKATREQLRELSRLGIVKKYDLTPEQREMHDARIAKIRNDKDLTSEQKMAAYYEEDQVFGQF